MIAVDPNSRRDRLFRAIELGRLTPDQGEEIARRRNLPALMPEPAVIDVSAQLRWTLPMSLAWLVWGDLESVARYAPERRETAFFWRSVRPVLPNRREGAVPEAAKSGRPNMRDLSIAVAYSEVHEEHMAMSLAGARAQLWQWLGEGTLTALGYSDNGELKSIGTDLWGELQEHISLRVDDALSYRGATHEIAFRQVTVDRAKLMLLSQGEATEQVGDPLANAARLALQVRDIPTDEVPRTAQATVAKSKKGHRGRQPGDGAIDDMASLHAIRSRAGGDSTRWWQECGVQAGILEPKADAKRLLSIQKRLRTKMNQLS